MSSLSLTQNTKVGLYTRQTLSSSFVMMLQQLLEEVAPATSVIKLALENAEPAQFKLQNLNLHNDAMFVQAIARNAAMLCSPTEEGFLRVAVQYVFYLQCGDDSSSGEIYFDKNSLVGSSLELAVFEDAFLRPQEFEKSIDAAKHFLSLNNSSYEGALAEIRRKEIALHARDILNDVVRQMAKIIMIYFQQKNSAGDSSMTSACKRVMITKTFTPVLSERFLKRFNDRFKFVGSGKKDTLRNAFLNTIAEYVLIGCGVILPEVFALYAWNMKDTELVQNLNDLDTSIDDILGKQSQTLYCSRWAVKGQKRTSLTDGAILDFITKTIRRDSGVIFSAFSFDDFIYEIAEINTTTTSTVDRFVMKGEVLFNLLDDAYFHEVILELITTSWFPALDTFMNPIKKDKS